MVSWSKDTVLGQEYDMGCIGQQGVLGLLGIEGVIKEMKESRICQLFSQEPRTIV